MQPAPFPTSRPRRLRGSRVLRELVREHELSRRDLVAPLFVKEGIGEPVPIASMPGHAQHTLESLRKEAAELAGLGIPALLLFGIPAAKDAEGSQAWAPEGIIQRALRALHADLGDDVALIADLCLCEYTDHGHCGVLGPPGPGAAVEGPVVANDPTLERYGRIAVAQADAGPR
jgi:porphobilinogen synthase